MHSIQFWKSWSPAYRFIFYCLALVFSIALLVMLWAYVKSPEPTFSWQQQQELIEQEIPVQAFETGGFHFEISTQNYILFERWSANPIKINIANIDLYAFTFFFSLAVMLSLFTVLKRFWYYTSCAMIIFLFTSFQWEGLALAGFENRIPTGIVITLVLGLSLFYQYFRMTASLLERLLAFLLLFIFIGVSVQQFAGIAQPLRYLSVNTLPAAIAMLIVFMIMVAHEIIAAFAGLTNQKSGKGRNLRNFVLVSGVYLLNVWLVYLDRIGWMDWDLTISPIIILAASGILTIWGIRLRQPQYEQVINADPFAVYFILSLGSIAFSVLGYFLTSSEDVAILSLNDMILYTHIGYGMIFVAYIGANFGNLILKSIPIQKVLYKPTTLPYFTYRLAGLIFTFALVAYNTWMVPVNHFRSAHYTAIGDYYYSQENVVFAFGYYKKANEIAPYNQHASTAMALMEENNFLYSSRYLHDANQFMPTDFTLMNEADKFHTTGKTLEEVIFLTQAIHDHPASPILKNNLGLAYARMGLSDSAALLFERARKTTGMEATADMNLLGLMAKKQTEVSPDSVYQLLNLPDNRVRSNTLAIANQQGKVMDMIPEFPKDSVLDLFSATTIGNYLTNHIYQADTALLAKCIRYAKVPSNKAFKPIIFAPASRVSFAAGRVNEAFHLMGELIFEGIDQGKNNSTLALWALQQQKPEVAAIYLQYAIHQGDKEISWTNAVTLAEAGKTNESLIAWDTLSRGKDTVMLNLGESMKRVLGGPESWYGDFSDEEKYRFLRYRTKPEDSLVFDRLLRQIKDEDTKARAVFDRARKWFALGQTSRAKKMYERLQGLHLTDTELFARIKYFELQLFASSGELSIVRDQIAKGILFGPYRECERVYYEALRQNEAGDTINASHNFKWLAYANVYFDDGIIASAEFFKKKSTGIYSPYTILSEALQMNPSVKILQAYIPIAIKSGYEQYALSSLLTLQGKIPANDFRQYVIKNQLQNLLQQ